MIIILLFSAPQQAHALASAANSAGLCSFSWRPVAYFRAALPNDNGQRVYTLAIGLTRNTFCWNYWIHTLMARSINRFRPRL